jgi:hypothetical protein
MTVGHLGPVGLALNPMGLAAKYKKRPELFSSGRLGSPPPELPNHESDTRLGLWGCKRHFGNPNYLNQ